MLLNDKQTSNRLHNAIVRSRSCNFSKIQRHAIEKFLFQWFLSLPQNGSKPVTLRAGVMIRCGYCKRLHKTMGCKQNKSLKWGSNEWGLTARNFTLRYFGNKTKIWENKCAIYNFPLAADSYRPILNGNYKSRLRHVLTTVLWRILSRII
jgi:hypothetical protein